MTNARLCRPAGWFLVAVLIPLTTHGQDSARISRLESEIQQLRAQIDEQNRRIQRLEAELNRRAGAPAVPPQSRKPVVTSQPVESPATKPQPWHAPAAWERIAKGMSVEQVRTILGEPTAIESVESLKTLFYRGAVSGHVNFRDERVVAVSKPSF